MRNKTTLLQIEKISQAAAQQRAGRCGRVQNGICVRLYGEDDFAARPAYTEPEILRSSLAGVILRMAALDLGPVADFPFVEPPAPRAIADGYQLLQELDAVDAGNALTPRGRELARLPLDPRIGRMVLAARDDGCLRRGAGHRERAVGARSARAAARQARRRPTRRTCASATSAPTSCRCSRCGSSSRRRSRAKLSHRRAVDHAARISCRTCA